MMKGKIAIKENVFINHIENVNYSDLNVLGAGYEKTARNKELRALKDFTCFSLHFVASGRGYYTLNGKKYEVRKNSVFCIFPDMPIEYVPDRKAPWTYYWINFGGSKSYELLRRAHITPENPIIELEGTEIGRLFIQNMINCREYEGVSDVVALSYLYRIFSLLLISRGSAQTKVSSELPAKVLDYLNQNYSNPDLNIQIVASYFNITSAYLSRVLKKATGATFTTHLTSVRIKAAIRLIDEGTYSVSEVAYTVGFNDPYYFSNVFKKYNYCSPKEHIRKVKESNRKKINY